MNLNQSSASDKSVKKRVDDVIFELRVTANIIGSHANFADTNMPKKSHQRWMFGTDGVLIIADHSGRKLYHRKRVCSLSCLSCFYPHSLVGKPL